MLKQLSIKNYAIIDALDVDFGKGLHTITGETGAGKSILLGALSLVLGQRADTGVLRDASKKSVIEAIFDIKAYELKQFFADHDLDYEEESFFRREITPSGKSRAFINDTPVNLQILKNISSRLVNVHSQHDTLELASPAFQLHMVDRLAGNEQLISSYKKSFTTYQQTQQELNKLKSSLEQSMADKEYHTFLYNELVTAELDGCNLEEIEQEFKTSENAEEIKQKLSAAYLSLEEQDLNLITQLNQILTELQSVEAYMPEIKKLSERLESTSIELQDIAAEVYQLSESVEFQPEVLEQLREKVDLINRLLQKHQLQSVEELIALREELKEKIDGIESSDERIAELEEKLAKQKSETLSIAGELHHQRKQSAKSVSQEVRELVGSLGMPNAQFNVEVQKNTDDTLGPDGYDVVKFLFSANPGSELKELRKIASGGELSRLMLSIKSLIARQTALPTLIFDEIDTGVSGEVAIKVGELMEKTAEGHQVISITHLPQIAAKGTNHYFVYKEAVNGNTFTRMKKLNPAEREQELAKMLSGEDFSNAALENARQLLSK